jgi:hypothetical protein
MEFPFVPPPQDSGYYGAPRAPLVLPGTYTVQLAADGRLLSRPVTVRADPRAGTTLAALRARAATAMRARELARAYADAAAAVAALDAELTRLRSASAARRERAPQADSALAGVAARLDSLRPRLRSDYSTPIGRVFDVLGALESSSGAPTDAMRRTLESYAAQLREVLVRLNEVITVGMPPVRAALGPAGTAATPVRLPE